LSYTKYDRRNSHGAPVSFLIGCILATAISAFILYKHSQQKGTPDDFQFDLVTAKSSASGTNAKPESRRPTPDGGRIAHFMPPRETSRPNNGQAAEPDTTPDLKIELPGDDTSSASDGAHRPANPEPIDSVDSDAPRADRVVSATNYKYYLFQGYGIAHPEKPDQYHLEIVLNSPDRNRWPRERDDWLSLRDRAAVFSSSGTRYQCRTMLGNPKGNEINVLMLFFVPRNVRITRLHIEDREWKISRVEMGEW